MHSLNDLLLMTRIKLDSLGDNIMGTNVGSGIPEIDNELKNVSKLYDQLVGGFFGFVTMFLFVWAVIRLIKRGLAQDDEKRKAEGKKIKNMGYSIIGIVVISSVLGAILGVVKPYIINRFK